MKIEFVKDEMLQLYRVKTDESDNETDSFHVDMTDDEIKRYFVAMNDFLDIQRRLAAAHLVSVMEKENKKRELRQEALVRNHAFPEDDPRAFMKLSEIPKVNETGPTWPDDKL